MIGAHRLSDTPGEGGAKGRVAPIFSDFENFLAHWYTNRSAT